MEGKLNKWSLKIINNNKGSISIYAINIFKFKKLLKY